MLGFQSFMPESLPDVRDIALCNIVAQYTGKIATFSQPPTLQRELEAALIDRVFGQLTHIYRTEFVDLCSHRVLLDQRLFGEREL